MGYKELEKMNMHELVDLEKASVALCTKYENTSKIYDGSFKEGDSYDKFTKYNNFREAVLNRMEEIIDGIIEK